MANLTVHFFHLLFKKGSSFLTVPDLTHARAIADKRIKRAEIFEGKIEYEYEKRSYWNEKIYKM